MTMMMNMSRYSKISAFVLPRLRPTTVAKATVDESPTSFWISLTPPLATTTTTHVHFPDAANKATTRLFSASSTTTATTTNNNNNNNQEDSSTTPPKLLKRVKTIDAVEPTEDHVVIKGWVRTIRKQKTVAFVQVNDGSTLKGIQCVVSFDGIDETTMKGRTITWLLL